MKQRCGLDRNVLRPTPGDPWGVEQHHWNTGAEENQQLNPISAQKFDPLRSRANGFIIDTKHLKLVRSNSMVIGLA